ncbi:MAG: hypothetical protein NC180_00480 [Muribaculaceae bacterium]|nr:restriction endonuclease subunit M [Roseburia sp.]MCM1431638.1 hypothetical protein [Muribaculaceae bacterium]MCM1491690.1 hypothetical protein [Muribaculaceae bacterium]
MKELRNKLEYLLKTSNVNPSVIEAIKNESSVPPFSTESRLLAYLLAIGKIDYKEYSDLSDEFCTRNQLQNQYIWLFDMAPRTFGQTWGEQHIKKLFPQFMNATKENLAALYPSFDGEFDLWIDGIRVEVKACRANSATTKGSLSSRAYTHEEAKRANFKYHYQQLKPSCCDVFIWIGVCKDELIYWVLTSEELQRTGKLGSQHRNENTGIAGAEVFEGQVFMTEDELKMFWVEEKDILSRVIEKGTK